MIYATPVQFDLNTDGSGLWSGEARRVGINHLVVEHYDEGYGELRVLYNSDWDIHQLGLIYTDKLWLKELKNQLAQLGITGEIHYSEQGMQGEDYVSLDCDAQFCESFGEYSAKKTG